MESKIETYQANATQCEVRAQTCLQSFGAIFSNWLSIGESSHLKQPMQQNRQKRGIKSSLRPMQASYMSPRRCNSLYKSPIISNDSDDSDDNDDDDSGAADNKSSLAA